MQDVCLRRRPPSPSRDPAGLAADANREEGIDTIYDIKQRRQGLPLAICVASADRVAEYGETEHLPGGLLARLLPGPVTVLLKRKQLAKLAASLNPGVETIGASRVSSPVQLRSRHRIGSYGVSARSEVRVALLGAGIRVPDSSFIQELCAAYQSAIALTSANVSGAESSLRIEDFQELWPRCSVIYEGGPIPASPLGSTIIDLSEAGRYRVIRPGVAAEQTRAILSQFSIQEKTA